LKYDTNYFKYDTIDSEEFIELEDLFNNSLKYSNKNEINEYIEKIEQMIVELKGFEKCVLK
jgi:hypothetical protein